MTKKLLAGLVVIGFVLAGATGFASAHDDGVRPGPPDLGQLDRYGEWGWEPPYGRVWVPYVEADWRPYWRGHWAWQGGWVWVSADPWGDGPFHYGEWTWSRRLGWVWIPGTVWAPARVTWIVSGPIVAWTPASLHVSIGSDPRFWVYADAWTFQGPIVRPHRVPPPHARVRHGIRSLAPGRVFAPDTEHRGRQFRTGDEAERRNVVRPDRRVAAPRTDARVRAPHRDSRGRTAESGHARGFDLRERR
ncbi:MAG: DUF6600 domain-containing protein [Nitrospirota bacterium]